MRCHALPISFLIALIAVPAFAQSNSAALAQQIIDEAFPEPRGPHAAVLLVGTFHFQDAGLDSYKPQHAIDVFSEETQRQIEAVAEALAAFKPTRVAIERKPDHAEKLAAEFAHYTQGEFELPANELYQLGFRVAKLCGLDGVHPIDAPGRWFDPQIDHDEFAEEHDQREFLRDPYAAANFRMAQRLDALKVEHPLRDHLLLMNEPVLLQQQHGIYLKRNLALRDGETYPAADGFVSQWYNRNLRIYGNLQRIIETDDERILVIFGAGHMPILRHLKQHAPNMTLVEVDDVL